MSEPDDPPHPREAPHAGADDAWTVSAPATGDDDDAGDTTGDRDGPGRETDSDREPAGKVGGRGDPREPRDGAAGELSNAGNDDALASGRDDATVGRRVTGEVSVPPAGQSPADAQRERAAAVGAVNSGDAVTDAPAAGYDASVQVDPGLGALTDDPEQPLPRPVTAELERPRRLSSRATVIALVVGALLVVVAVVGVLSYANSRDWYLSCGATSVTAERGSWWPWGRTELTGRVWRPIRIPPSSTCTDRTLGSRAALKLAFTHMLIREASARLTTGDTAAVDEAERQLEQALLLTRARPAERAAIERLAGSVAYWRGVPQVTSVIEQLEAAAGQFRAAAEAGARNTDAAQWARHTSQLADELRQGPRELRSAVPKGPSEAPSFAGTESAPAPERAPADANAAVVDAGAGAPAAPPVSPTETSLPDAGLPTGGVLL